MVLLHSGSPKGAKSIAAKWATNRCSVAVIPVETAGLAGSALALGFRRILTVKRTRP
jgi:hypothetical protein